MGEAHQVLEFVTQDSFTPSALPMTRLAEALGGLATVLGEKEHVHLPDRLDGSSEVAHVADPDVTSASTGTGRSSRDGDGQWEMRSFRISHFDELDDRPLAETVAPADRWAQGPTGPGHPHKARGISGAVKR